MYVSSTFDLETQGHTHSSTKNEEVHTIFNLTLTLKVNCQGHVINFGLFDITDLTKI